MIAEGIAASANDPLESPRRTIRLVRGRPAPMIGLVILLAFVIMALLAPLIAPHYQRNVGPPFASPTAAHPLGLDDIGEDNLSQLIWGARVSMLVGFLAALMSVAIGGVVGLVAGYYGRWADTALVAVTDYFLILPVLPLAIVIATLYGPSLRNEIVIIGLLSWPTAMRVVRSEVKSIRERTFVQRAHALGASHVRILTRHILPAVSPLLMATTVIAVGNAIFFEAALSFLGLGDPTSVSWGRMIADAFSQGAVSAGAWWAIVPPGVAIGTVVLATSLFGRSFEDVLNPRLGLTHVGSRQFRVRPREKELDDHPARISAMDRRDPKQVIAADVVAETDSTAPRQEPLLAVEDLHVWFDLASGRELHAVRGVSLSLEAGERVGLVGESGCGKTTTILAMMGLLPPSASVAGRVTLGGCDLLIKGDQSVRPHRWVDIAMVFQGAMNALNPVKTIASQIAEPMQLHQTQSASAARARVDELLEMVGIGSRRGSQYPHQFSGGMRQRAAIAMALACEPKVLLADEPTTALDVMVQAQILELLLQLTRELGLGLILVTHDLPVVAQFCHRAAVMYAGQICEEAPVGALYNEPKHPYTRRLFEATPDLYGAEGVSSIGGTPPRLDETIIGCSFAPRCEHAFGACLVTDPPSREFNHSHRAACHLNDLGRQDERSDE